MRQLERTARAVRYIVRDRRALRHLGYLLRALRPGASPLSDERPWVTLGAYEWLEENLRPDMNVFEYGSGGSTLYLARRVSWLESVEHDPEWHRRVAAALEAEGLLNCRSRLAEPQPLATQGLQRYVSQRARYAGLSFEMYARAIDDRAAASLDLVLIDGRARMQCTEHALPKIRPGGWLMLDNSERREYESLRRTLDGYECLDFFGVGPYLPKPWQTSVWRIR